jgi:hypothetical protein
MHTKTKPAKWFGPFLKQMFVAIALSGVSVPNCELYGSEVNEIWKQAPAPLPLPNSIRSGYASLNGIKLYYAIFGKG